MRELREIIDDMRDNIAEACAAGYADGVRMAVDERTSERDGLCDAFVRVWNDRAQLLSNDGKAPESVITSTDGDVTTITYHYAPFVDPAVFKVGIGEYIATKGKRLHKVIGYAVGDDGRPCYVTNSLKDCEGWRTYLTPVEDVACKYERIEL